MVEPGAWVLEAPGDADAFVYVPREPPRPQPGWVLLAVEAFGLNRSELFSRLGLSSPDFTFPRVLGLECVGRVLDPGGSDLTPGEPVMALMGGMGRAIDGSYATHVVVPRQQVFRRTPSVGHLDPVIAAAVPETLNTATLGCLHDLALTGEDRVLVRGGTSALGLAAASIAHHLGCEVVSTTRDPAKAQRMATLGYTPVLDDADVVDRLREAMPTGFTAVVECVGSPESVTTSCAALVDGGRLGQVGQLSQTWGEQHVIPERIRASFTNSGRVASPADDARMQTIVDRVAAGDWRLPVHHVYPLEELPIAHVEMESNRAFGKLVVRVS